MTKVISPIRWTEKQKQIAVLLQQGSANKDVAAKLGVAKSLVSKVNKALKQGFTPSSESQTATSNPVTASQTAASSNAVISSPNTGEKKVPPEVIPSGPDTEVEAKLVSSPVIIPLTQIMVSSKAYLVQVKHWPVETKWQDIIDTIFYTYFKSLNPPVILQGWYIGEPGKDNSSPKPARVDDKDNGHKVAIPDVDSPAFKKLADMVTMQIIDMAQKGQLGG